MTIHNTTPQKDMEYVIKHMVPYKKYNPNTPGDYQPTRYITELNKSSLYNVFMKICKIAAVCLLIGVVGIVICGVGMKLVEEKGGNADGWIYMCAVSGFLMIGGLAVVIITAIICAPMENKANRMDKNEIQAQNVTIYKLDTGEIALVNVAKDTAMGRQMRPHIDNFTNNTYPYLHIPFYYIEFIKRIRKVTKENGRYSLVVDLERRELDFTFRYVDNVELTTEFER
ncbi:MAG: hypothetical protein ACI4EF_06740, partial [Coprococcus sp.]